MKKLAICVELSGIAVIAIGIAIELIYAATIGFVAITTGSLLLVVGGFIWAKVTSKGGIT